MSGFSSQGVGLAASAKLAVVDAQAARAVSAAAIKMVLVANPVILHAPRPLVWKRLSGIGPPANLPNKSRTPLSRQYDERVCGGTRVQDFGISRCLLRD